MKNTSVLQKIIRMAALALPLLLSFAAFSPSFAEEIDIGTLSPCALPEQSDPGVTALYCGPTQGFYRNGEATLDTHEPFVCFGQYDCWAMVAAGTAEAFGPAGWVESAALDGLDTVPSLGFDDALCVMIEDDTFLTDDPLAASPEPLSTIARGAQVTLLARFEGWGYVQTEIEGTPVRAFVPLSAIL